MENVIKTRYEIDRLEGSITLWHPNEKILLYAIYELDDSQIYVDEKYSLIRISLSELLNKGENINRLEVLRDFNGWNWNTDPNELQNVAINLVYQNLIELLGLDFMEQWVHEEKIKDYLALAKEKIAKQFGEESEKEIFNLISKIALTICIQTNLKQKEYLLEEQKDLQEELERISNKRKLLEEISQNKKEAFNQIKEIDKILSDKKLLEQEYVKRNEALPEYHKIFSLAHLTEILTKQRKKIMIKMEEDNKILEPVQYIKVKTKLEEKLELLSSLQLNQNEIKERITSYNIELQKKVMECFKAKIQKIDELEKAQKKEQLIKYIYKFRYYCYLYLDSNRYIEHVEELKEDVEQIKNILIQKAEELKCITRIAKTQKNNIEILGIMFETRMINLENMAIELKQENILQAYIYDTNLLEKKIVLEIPKEDLVVKLDKKIKILC